MGLNDPRPFRHVFIIIFKIPNEAKTNVKSDTDQNMDQKQKRKTNKIKQNTSQET